MPSSWKKWLVAALAAAAGVFGLLRAFPDHTVADQVGKVGGAAVQVAAPVVEAIPVSDADAGR